MVVESQLGAQGVEERDAGTLERPSEAEVTLVASFEDEAGAQQAIAHLAPRKATLKFVVGDDWREKYKEYFKVTRLGPRLVIRPSWEPYEPGPSDVVVTVDPGRAFGTGTHESTRLLMSELDGLIRGGESVLDVGCGTGILAIAALQLGAREARCIDVDGAAVEVTLENAALNGVADRIAEASTTPVEDMPGTFDVVLANIQASVLIPLAEPIAARVAPGGSLLLSGILVEQRDDVLAAYPGFRCEADPVEGEWVALRLTRG